MTSQLEARDVVFERREEYLAARVPTNEVDRSTLFGHFADIMSKCAETRLKRVLIEADLSHSAAAKEMSTVINEVVSMTHGMRIALVNTNHSVSNALAIDVDGEAHDGADYRFFTDPAEAEAWIADAQPYPKAV